MGAGMHSALALTEIGAWFDGVKAEFTLNFIDKSRWKLLWGGLQNTLLITLVACLMGIAIGVVVATVRTTWDTTGQRARRGLGRSLLAIADRLCRFYITVIRGTPVVIQLMLMYYVIFASSDNGVVVAILAFGLNSGAYVAEIFRGGIMSIDKGQFEAGRSLGLNYTQTMMYIIAPQVLKTVLPTLANEFIVLLKETSVAGYVAVGDLTFGGNRIRGITYSAFMPLIAVALIYLALVIFLSWLVGKLERRLRQSDNR
ncbi:MAG: amino acid ABC transporter permease [Candidatus Limiplasma sp.]|nr:amino acid ABC transporter permease [Candidatus Limiplasma sp.]